MSSDTDKRKLQRLRLAAAIDLFGDKMEHPCTRCHKQKKTCVVDSSDSSESRRCSECVRSKVRCDLRDDPWDKHVPSLSDWASIEKQKQKLEEQEEEAMAKILCL